MEKQMKNVKYRSENPDPIDVHVGARLRLRRNLAGFSQEQLGKSLGLTFQQVQKYERGTNRMGSSRLFQVAKILSVPVAYFFEDLPSALSQPIQPGFADNDQAPIQNAPKPGELDDAVLHRRETLEFVRAYYRIQDPKKRQKIYQLVHSMSDEQAESREK